MLLGNDKSCGQSATLHELWNGRAKHDPLNSSLSFVGAIENGMLISKQAIIGQTVKVAMKELLDKLLRQFSDCLCRFQPHDRKRFVQAGKLNEV